MTDDFKTKMRSIVQAADFLPDNYLSTDLRVPVTLLETNACSPLASNAIAGTIWDNFSSQSYKDLAVRGSDHRSKSLYRGTKTISRRREAVEGTPVRPV